MNIGDLVKYKSIFLSEHVGIIVDSQSLGLRMLVEWNNGEQNCRHINVLEVICE